MCLYPKIIKNRKYTSTKKNDGNVPIMTDDRVKYVPVGCGNCMECRKQKARGWQVRLLEDIKTNKGGKFITLTFSNKSIKEILEKIEEYNTYNGLEPLEGYELDNQIATFATRLFLERWRKKYNVSLRHWLVTELGHNGTENIHMHGIVWTDKLQQVEKIWQYGFVWKGKPRQKEKNKIEYINYVNEQTVNYIIKYINKVDEIHTTYKSKVLTSAGIGRNYTETLNAKKNKFKNEKTNETYKTRTGHTIALPTYWRNKLWTEDEKEKLWLQRLDKEERWVSGERVDISQGEEIYYATLKWWQTKNKELGYGDDIKNWEKEHYEKLRRITLIRKRIQSASPAGQ